jgi:hypothetical protein
MESNSAILFVNLDVVESLEVLRRCLPGAMSETVGNLYWKLSWSLAGPRLVLLIRRGRAIALTVELIVVSCGDGGEELGDYSNIYVNKAETEQ